MKTYSIFGTLILATLLTACSEDSKLSQLKTKKNKLRAELTEVQDKITALEAGLTEGVIPLVTLADVQTKTFVHKITVQGNVETDEDVLLNAEMGGTIMQVMVKEGQRVSQGQVLVTLDASILSSNMQELETQLQYAQYMLEKQEELKKRGVGSEFDYKTAKNQVDGLKSKMKSLGTQRGKSTIKAPFSGVIDKIYAKNGQLAGPQAPLMRLVNNKEVNFTADISEKHLRNIEVGTPLTVRFPNFKDTAVVTSITSVGNYIDPTNRTFRILSNLKNNKIFLPNMLAELEITDITAPNATVVPSKAVLKAQDNSDYVFVAKKDAKGNYTLSKIAVKVIEKFNGEAMIELVSGSLKAGEKVVVDGARGITEQDIVRTK
jgi:RND family efflux transporter MFP subunit